MLDSPLDGLLHFLQELRARPGTPDVRAGDVTTAGALTDARLARVGRTGRRSLIRHLLDSRFGSSKRFDNGSLAVVHGQRFVCASRGKLMFAVPIGLKAELDRYAAVHAQTYGETMDAEKLIPLM